MWGFFPLAFDAAAPGGCAGSVQGCYQNGDILGWGRQTVNSYNYPNTFAIVLGNEWDQNLQAFPVLKAYARDLNYHMTMCNTNDGSATKGYMRGIPLMYASTDGADSEILAVADYLFCGDDVQYSPRINAFGLNIERWIEGSPGQVQQYETLSSAVLNRSYPGAWFNTEEGGPISNGQRNWSELPNFFTRFPGFDGFAAYVYYGQPDFDMFSSPFPDGNETEDAKKFFSEVAKVGNMPPTPITPAKVPTCATQLTFKGKTVDLIDFHQLQAYDTGTNSLAAQCPRPWQAGLGPTSLATSFEAPHLATAPEGPEDVVAV